MSNANPQPTGPLGVLPFRDFFTLDVRSLALFRVGLAVMILLDWIDRLPDLGTHYSDAGLVPRSSLHGINPLSVHIFSGSVWLQAVLAFIAIVAGLALLVGWRTSLSCLVSWFLLVSVHGRNPAVLQGGDHLIRMLAFWGIFLPLGACYSLDAARANSTPASPRVLTAASFAYVVQLVVVYFFASIWKWSPEWRDDGTAIHLALQVEPFTTRFAYQLMRFPELLRWMTHAVLYLEMLGPVLLFLPFNVGLQRLIAIGLFISFHLGLALSMELGNFPWVCMVAWLPMLPGSLWDKMAATLRPAGDGLTLLYDPERPWARDATAGLRSWLFLWEAKHQAADPSTAVRLRQQGGWAVVAEKQQLTGTDALARLVAASPVFFPLVRLCTTALGRWLAGAIGRTGWTRKEPARPAWATPGGLVVNVVILFLLVYVVLLNTRNFGTSRARWYNESASVHAEWNALLPNPNLAFGQAIGIDQGWGLFAPKPGGYGGWYHVIGERADGSRVDLFDGGKPIDEKSRPAHPAGTFANGRWRKILMNTSAFNHAMPISPTNHHYPYLVGDFARSVYHDWNSRHEGTGKVVAVEIVWWKQETRPPGEERPAPERFRLVRYDLVGEQERFDYYTPATQPKP